MLLRAGEIHHRLQGSINELGRPDQRNRQEQHGPIPQRQVQPEGHQHHQRANYGMDPGIALGAENIPPTVEGMHKGASTRGEEIPDPIHGRYSEKCQDV